MESGILNMIAKYMIADRLEHFVSSDKQYQGTQEEVARLDAQVAQLRLSREARLAIDRLLCANNASNARYSELAYMQGFRDCAALLKEIER